MPKAHQLPSGQWRCQPMKNGKRANILADTRAEAEYLAEQWKKTEAEQSKPENRTVGALMEQYIEERDAILSPTTIELYKSIRAHHLQSIIDKPIAKVTQNDVQMEVNEMAKKYSPKTIRNVVGFLRSACDIHYKLTLPRKEKTSYRTPGVEEIRNILTKTRGTDIEVPVLLALWCGLRLSEIRGLRFDHVYPDHIIIDRSIVDTKEGPAVKRPKTTESTRTIPIHPYLYDKIQSLPRHSDYITTLSGRAIYGRFIRVTNGVCRFHDLRHANASVMMMLGIPDKDAMERGGWETESTYKKTYAQVLPESREESNKAINDFFSTLVQQ